MASSPGGVFLDGDRFFVSMDKRLSIRGDCAESEVKADDGLSDCCAYNDSLIYVDIHVHIMCNLCMHKPQRMHTQYIHSTYCSLECIDSIYCSLLSKSFALEALLIGVHFKKRYINVYIQYNTTHTGNIGLHAYKDPYKNEPCCLDTHICA